jgi:hypothetical protein
VGRHADGREEARVASWWAVKRFLWTALGVLALAGLSCLGVWREALSLRADWAIDSEHALKGSPLVPTLHGAYGEPCHYQGVLRAKDGTGYTIFESMSPTVVIFMAAPGDVRTLVLLPADGSAAVRS